MRGCRCRPFTSCCGTRAPHPALRRQKGKAKNPAEYSLPALCLPTAPGWRFFGVDLGALLLAVRCCVVQHGILRCTGGQADRHIGQCIGVCAIAQTAPRNVVVLVLPQRKSPAGRPPHHRRDPRYARPAAHGHWRPDRDTAGRKRFPATGWPPQIMKSVTTGVSVPAASARPAATPSPNTV